MTRLVREYNSGMVELVEHMGDLTSVVRSARVSYQSGTKGVRDDTKLMRYLMQHQHMSPFECVYFTFHIKCPIYIARQVMRHRTFSYNELSARYSLLDVGIYQPQSFESQDPLKRQCRGSEKIEGVDEIYSQAVKASYEAYEQLLEKGVAREIARGVLPTASFTRFYMSGSLRNYLHFIKLRMDSHAQLEVQELANGMLSIMEQLHPEIIQAFRDFN